MSWICPKCERELKHENAWHNCAKVSLDELFRGKPDELLLVFDQLLAEVADWDDVLISTSRNCIVFVHHQTFLVIRPMAKALDVKFYSKLILEDNAIFKSEPWTGKFANHIRLSRTEEINPGIFRWIRGSYELL